MVCTDVFFLLFFIFNVSGFQLSVRSNVICICFISLCDWLTILAPLSQPMRISQWRVALANIFPRLAPVACNSTSNCDWFIEVFSSLVIGHCIDRVVALGRLPFTRFIRVEILGVNIQCYILSKCKMDKSQNVPV